jgi:hypothetical protein
MCIFIENDARNHERKIYQYVIFTFFSLQHIVMSLKCDLARTSPRFSSLASNPLIFYVSCRHTNNVLYN